MASSGRVFSNLIWRFLERCGAQLVTFVVSVVLARLLDPTIYGTVALITVFTTILQVFVDSGLGASLIQKKSADDLDFSTVFYFNILVCLVLYLLMFFIAPLIASFYKNSQMVLLIRILSLILIISGVKNIQVSYVSRNLIFKKFFWATLVGTITASIVGIILAYYLPYNQKVWALVIQNLVNQTIDTIMLWILVKWKPKPMFSWRRLKALFSYGWKLSASSFLDTGYNELRSLVIGRVYTSADLGYYNKGRQFPQLIISNINTSIDSVLLPSMSDVQEDRNRVKAMVKRSIMVSTFIIVPAMVGLAASSPSLIHVLLTDKWLPCVLYLQIACINFAFWPIYTANLNAIKALGRSDLFLKMEIVKKAVGLGLLFSFVWVSIEAFAWSALISTLFSLVVNTWPNKKLLGYSLFEQIKDMFPSIILSAIMGLVVYFIGYINGNSLKTLFLQVFLGVSIYFFGASFFKLKAFTYAVGVIKSFSKKVK